jgi:hypothetical protein
MSILFSTPLLLHPKTCLTFRVKIVSNFLRLIFRVKQKRRAKLPVCYMQSRNFGRKVANLTKELSPQQKTSTSKNLVLRNEKQAVFQSISCYNSAKDRRLAQNQTSHVSNTVFLRVRFSTLCIQFVPVRVPVTVGKMCICWWPWSYFREVKFMVYLSGLVSFCLHFIHFLILFRH